MKAICLPSGDQTGRLSRPLVVRRRTPVPSRFMLARIPVPSRTKAMRLPSGENAGAADERAPFVSCLRPPPECVIRKICSTPCPDGRPVKSSHCGLAEDRCGCPEAVAAAATASAATTTNRLSRRSPDAALLRGRVGPAPRLVSVALDAVAHRVGTVPARLRSDDGRNAVPLPLSAA